MSRIYVLEAGDVLVVSPAGVETIVYRPLIRIAGEAEPVAAAFRDFAEAIDRAAKATAPIWIPDRARSRTGRSAGG